MRQRAMSTGKARSTSVTSAVSSGAPHGEGSWTISATSSSPTVKNASPCHTSRFLSPVSNTSQLVSDSLLGEDELSRSALFLFCLYTPLEF